MNGQLEQIPLSEELLTVMRNSGRYSQQLREPFLGQLLFCQAEEKLWHSLGTECH